MWVRQPFESRMLVALKKQLGREKGELLFSRYVHSAEFVAREILRQIPGAQQAMTDHTESHIVDVMDNANALIGSKTLLSGVDLYCLGMSILFHDTGNLESRNNHQKNAAKYYDHCVASGGEPTEKHIVLEAIGAHTGSASDGTSNTIGQLEEIYHLGGKPVMLREIAAILRFADELSEGPHRTSTFMLNHAMYPAASVIFHKYAQIASHRIDREGGRIVVTNHLKLTTKSKPVTKNRKEFYDLLEFAFMRAVKLDDERKYTRYFSKVLQAFTATEISFTFEVDGEPQQLDLPKIVLSDLLIPGKKGRDLTEIEPAYNTKKIWEQLNSPKSGGRS